MAKGPNELKGGTRIRMCWCFNSHASWTGQRGCYPHCNRERNPAQYPAAIRKETQRTMFSPLGSYGSSARMCLPNSPAVVFQRHEEIRKSLGGRPLVPVSILLCTVCTSQSTASALATTTRSSLSTSHHQIMYSGGVHS